MSIIHHAPPVARAAPGAGVELDPTAWRDFRIVGDPPGLISRRAKATWGSSHKSGKKGIPQVFWLRCVAIASSGYSDGQNPLGPVDQRRRPDGRVFGHDKFLRILDSFTPEMGRTCRTVFRGRR